MTIAVARAVPTGHLWLFLPPLAQPEADAEASPSSGADAAATPSSSGGGGGSRGACFSGPAFAGAAAAVNLGGHGDSNGSSSNDSSGSGDSSGGNSGACVSLGGSSLHVWRVAVAVGENGGGLIVEW